MRRTLRSVGHRLPVAAGSAARRAETWHRGVGWAVGVCANGQGACDWASACVYAYVYVNVRAQVRGYACQVNWNVRVRGRGECAYVRDRCHCYGHVMRPRVGAQYGLCCAALPHPHRAQIRSLVTVLRRELWSGGPDLRATPCVSSSLALLRRVFWI